MDNRKAKPSPADLAAAKKLRAEWDARARGLALTQDKMAAKMGGSQGLVSQYLNGTIGLNYRALLLFADALQIKPETIRTDLPEQQLTGSGAPVGASHSAIPDGDTIADAMGFLDELDGILGNEISLRPNPFRLAIALQVVTEGEIVDGKSVVVRLADRIRDWEKKHGNESGEASRAGAADGGPHEGRAGKKAAAARR